MVTWSCWCLPGFYIEKRHFFFEINIFWRAKLYYYVIELPIGFSLHRLTPIQYSYNYGNLYFHHFTLHLLFSILLNGRAFFPSIQILVLFTRLYFRLYYFNYQIVLDLASQEYLQDGSSLFFDIPVILKVLFYF